MKAEDTSLIKAVVVYVLAFVVIIVMVVGSIWLDVWIKRDILGVPYCISGGR